MIKSQGLRKPYRIRRKKSILKNRFFQYGVLFSILFISIFYLLIFSSVFQIEKIVITGEDKVSAEEIKTAVEKEIQRKILFFSTKSIFLANCQKITKSVLNNFPTIAKIEISRGFPRVLNVVVIERLGIACWQQEEQYFLLDDKGIIFDPLYQKIGVGARKIFEENPKLLKIESRTQDRELKPGDRVIEKEKIAEILWIISELKQNLKIAVDLAEIVSEERLNVKTNKGWEIYFNTKEDINWQITEIDLLLQNKIPLEKRDALEYIDLRFSRVYYKYR